MNFKTWLALDEEEQLVNELIELCEDKIVGAYRAKQLRKVLKKAGMPNSKRKHSERVTKGVHSLFVPSRKSGTQLNQEQWTTVMAAFFHDYLERGGDHSVLAKLNLPPKTIQAVNALTSEKDSEDPLQHLKAVLPTLDEELRNIVILVKLSDRIDNLTKRYNSSGISKNYLAKSNDLIKWLFQQYSGNPQYLMILRKRLRNLGATAKKKYIQMKFVQL